MVITKDKLQYIINQLPDSVDIEEVFNKILLTVKIDRALDESDQGLGQDWNEFTKEWLAEN